MKRPNKTKRREPKIDDIPEMPDAKLRTMRPTQEVVPAAIKRAIGQRGKGRRPAKIAVSIRLEADVLDAYKAGGARWQSRMNEVLKLHAPKERIAAKR